MRTLILNQAFHPDVVSTGQHATDLAVALRQVGHEVTVIASNRGYDDPSRSFPSHQRWQDIDIYRVNQLSLGKSSRLRRALDFASFLLPCAIRMLRLPRQDVVIALTSPPLISALSALAPRARFVFWVMDLNPDEAIAAGWLSANSIVGRILAAILNYSLRRADQVIALDRFMQQRLVAKGVPPSKISVIPPWSHDEVAYDEAGRTNFRAKHGLDRKFVVMYSGNHSPCHPLDTLLQAAAHLPHIAFAFIGGGSEFAKVQQSRLPNILCLPYQPREQLSASLSAADLHVVAMGDPFVGIVHPCKVYNIRTLGIPFLYIGPSPSHVTELHPNGSFRHGDVAGVTDFILRSAASSQARPIASPEPHLLTRMVETINSQNRRQPECTLSSFSASRRSR